MPVHSRKGQDTEPVQLSSSPLVLTHFSMGVVFVWPRDFALSFVSGGWGLFLTHVSVSQHPEWALPNVSAQQMLGD